MKTTVEISDALFEEAKHYAAARGVSFREVVEAGIRQMIDAGRARAGSAFRLRKHTFKGRGIASEGGWETVREQIYKGRGE